MICISNARALPYPDRFRPFLRVAAHLAVSERIRARRILGGLCMLFANAFQALR